MHRLWEPLAAKQTPAERLCRQVLARPIASPPASCAAMSASTPSPTTRCAIRRVLALAAQGPLPRSIPHNPYPNNFTGHIRATLARRPRGRGAPAAHARRRARAADARATSRRNSCSTRATAAGTSARAHAALALREAVRRPDRSVRACGGDSAMNRMTKELAGRVARRHRRRPQHRPRHRAGARRGGAAVVVNARSNRAEAERVVRRDRGRRRQGAARSSPTSPMPPRSRRWRPRRRSSSAASTILVNNAALRGEKAVRAHDARGLARGHRRSSSTAHSTA